MGVLACAILTTVAATTCSIRQFWVEIVVFIMLFKVFGEFLVVKDAFAL